MRLLRPLEQWRVEGESANWARPAESMCNLSSPTGPAGAGPAPSQPCACTCCPGGSGSGLARGQRQAGAGSPCSRTALPPQPACWGLLRVLSQRRITVRGTAGAGPAVFSRSFCFLAPRVSLSACSVRFASLLCARLSHVAHLGYGGGLLGALQGSPHHPTPFAQSEPSVKKPAEILISLSAYTRPTLSKGHSHHN